MGIYAVGCAINGPSARRNTFVDIDVNSSTVMTKLNSKFLEETVDTQGFLDVNLRNLVYNIHMAFCDVLSGAVFNLLCIFLFLILCGVNLHIRK